MAFQKKFEISPMGLSIHPGGCVIHVPARHRASLREHTESQMSSNSNPNDSSKSPLNVTVSAEVAAPAEVVYSLISDVTRMPEFSPENTRGEWLGGASGPTVGARFKGTNKLGNTTWSTKPTVTVAEPGSVFAFKVPGASGALWTYELAEHGGVTVVTESMVQQKASSSLIRWFQRRAGVTDRAANLRDAMTITLERVAAVAECRGAA